MKRVADLIESVISHPTGQRVAGLLLMCVAASALSSLFHIATMRAMDAKLREFDATRSSYARERNLVLKALGDRTSGRWTVELEKQAWDYFAEHGETPPIGTIHSENWMDPPYVEDLLEDE